MELSLNNIRMHVTQTSEHGVVNRETIFHFTQNGNDVSAEYSGGGIQQGYLVGVMMGNKLKFTYCQRQKDGVLDCGTSICDVSVDEDSKLQLAEHFDWKSRPGEQGINIFTQI